MDFAQQVAKAAAEAASIRRNFLVDIHSKKEKITQNEQIWSKTQNGKSFQT